MGVHFHQFAIDSGQSGSAIAITTMHLRSALLLALLPMTGLSKPLAQQAANQSTVEDPNWDHCQTGEETEDFKPIDINAFDLARVSIAFCSIASRSLPPKSS